MTQFYTTESFLVDLECYEMHHLIDATNTDVALEADEESTSDKKKFSIDMKALGEKMAMHAKRAIKAFIEWCQKIIVKIMSLINRIKARKVKEITAHRQLVSAYKNMIDAIEKYVRVTGDFDDVFGMITNDSAAEAFGDMDSTTYAKLMRSKDSCTTIAKEFSNSDILKTRGVEEFLDKTNRSDTEYIKFDIDAAASALHDLEKALSNKKAKMSRMNAIFKVDYYLNLRFTSSQYRNLMKNLNGAIALQNYMISVGSNMAMRCQVYINTFLKMGEPRNVVEGKARVPEKEAEDFARNERNRRAGAPKALPA